LNVTTVMLAIPPLRPGGSLIVRPIFSLTMAPACEPAAGRTVVYGGSVGCGTVVIGWVVGGSVRRVEVVTVEAGLAVPREPMTTTAINAATTQRMIARARRLTVRDGAKGSETGTGRRTGPPGGVGPGGAWGAGADAGHGYGTGAGVGGTSGR
jgi:hypothetical protein